jgi:broad specificity phosphatase PhoE
VARLPRRAAPRVRERRLVRTEPFLSRRRRVVLWRHGQTLWNLENRFQGSTDVALDEVGIEQAARGASLLAALRPAKIVSSPLQRASATAAALARLTGLEVTYDERLRERFGGSWEGLTGHEIWERFPDQAGQWQPEDGEHESEVGERVAAAFTDAVAATAPGQTLVIVSHGGAVRCGIGRVLDLPKEVWWRLGPLGNSSWSVLGEVSGDGRGWRLLEHNAGTLPEPVLSDDR